MSTPESAGMPQSDSQVSHPQLLRCPPVRKSGFPPGSWLKENAIAIQGVNSMRHNGRTPIKASSLRPENLNLREGETSVVCPDCGARFTVLSEGGSDFAVEDEAERPRRSDLAMRSLFKEQLCVVCRADDKRIRGAKLRVADLADIPFVISGLPNTGVRRIVDAAAVPGG